MFIRHGVCSFYMGEHGEGIFIERQNLDLEIAEIRRIETELFGKNEEALDHLKDVVHAILGRVGARTQHSADKTSTGA